MFLLHYKVIYGTSQYQCLPLVIKFGLAFTSTMKAEKLEDERKREEAELKKEA